MDTVRTFSVSILDRIQVLIPNPKLQMTSGPVPALEKASDPEYLYPNYDYIFLQQNFRILCTASIYRDSSVKYFFGLIEIKERI